MDDRVKDQSDETGEWLDALDSVEAFEGIGKVDEMLDAVVTSARRKGAQAALRRQHRLRQHHSARSPAAASGRPPARAAHPPLRPLERRRDRRQGEQGIPPSSAAISRASSRRRPSTTPASCISGMPPTTTHGGDLIYFQGHSSPGIYARAFLEGRLSEDQLVNFRQEVGGKGLAVLSPSLADAGLLAVPDGLDGSRAVDGDLSGALPALSARPRPRRHGAAQGLGVLRRRRDGRAGIARRDLARRPREARQPHLRHQLQPAAPRRAGARQRQDRAGAGGRLPRRRLERHQVPVGLRLGRAARQGHGRASCAS